MGKTQSMMDKVLYDWIPKSVEKLKTDIESCTIEPIKEVLAQYEKFLDGIVENIKMWIEGDDQLLVCHGDIQEGNILLL